VVQARAPWVIAGKGVANLGVVPRAARLVDVAPTVASLLGCAPRSDGRYLSRQDGVVRDDVLDPAERPRHVVGFLFDGGPIPTCSTRWPRGPRRPNCGSADRDGHRVRARRDGRAPTVTLANHTSILTARTPATTAS